MYVPFLLLEYGPFEESLMLYVVPSVRNKWKALGEVLLGHDSTSVNHLNIIEANHRKDVKESCKAMLVKWIEVDKGANWKKLIEALQHSNVELDNLAQRIKKKLLEIGKKQNSAYLLQHLICTFITMAI